jgi:BASS family bile acid:Na+ symporter
MSAVITEVLIPVGLAIIMFAMGLTLTMADFRRVAARPKAMAAGLACKMVLLPLLAFTLVALFRPTPDFAVGLIILAACPGGITANLLTHLAGGATALAVSLTAFTSVVDTITVPLVVNLALHLFAGRADAVALPIERVSLGVFAVATLPLLLGMALNARAPAIAARIERVARPVATVLFALIVVGAFASQWRVMWANAAEVLPPALLLNAGCMAVAVLLGRLVRLERRETIAIVLETGLQNGALGIFVAATLLGSQAMMVPSIVYALVMNVTAIAFIFAARRMTRKVACASV